MLEQMDVTESSWPGPGFMEPMFPSAPSPAPMPSSMPTEESRPSSKPKAKKKKKRRQEKGAAEGRKEAGEKEKGSQEETPPLTTFAMTPAGASRRDAPAGPVRETKKRSGWDVGPALLFVAL